ncbi:MAG: SMP-30/gluconolactonase/LRE family protein [Alphaproteobacteria bacterium]|jgi:sugar lactone lactonase YvrE|nr:SMP-30/gluconolactonase/LRE family protein [Alphaproteobacteria bacterium]
MSGNGDIAGFRVQPSDLGFAGQGLTRPECVLCTASGDFYVSNWSGGVTRVAADGSQQDIVAEGQDIATNGFAISAEGDFLLANLHGEGSGAWRLRRDGSAEPFLTEIDGRRLPPANFVGVDRRGWVWVTVSTWSEPRQLAYRRDVADGIVVLVNDRGARIVADGLGYTNEAIVDASGDWLYVNETFGRRTSRFAIGADGALGPRETVTEYGAGVYPDGLAFDEAGGVWMTSVVSNRLIRVAPDGRQTVILEENDPTKLDEIEAVFQAGSLGREHLDAIETEVMKSISSIAFGGPDLKTIYLGNLLDDKVYTFQSPVAGVAPSHWRFTW